MGNVIKFPDKPEPDGVYEVLDATGWATFPAMLRSAADSIERGDIPCVGMCIIVYDDIATTVFRRGLSPNEVYDIAEDYMYCQEIEMDNGGC